MNLYLNITAYTGLQLVDAECDKNNGATRRKTSKPGCVKLFSDSGFLGRELPYKDAVYSYINSQNYYHGACIDYLNWREELARVVGYKATYGRYGRALHARGCWVGTEGPFYELIAFTDCEGVLGSIALRKLYSDFAMFEEHAKNSPVENFYDTYKSLMAGTLVAMKDGALVYSDCPD